MPSWESDSEVESLVEEGGEVGIGGKKFLPKYSSSLIPFSSVTASLTAFNTSALSPVVVGADVFSVSSVSFELSW